MSYPPPPPPPGAPGPGGDPGNQPTQAFPPQGPPTGPQYGGGYAPPPGATPPPGAPGYPPQPGGYAPQQPPKKGMSSGAIIGIVGVILVALLLAGVGVFLVTRDSGDDDDRADDRTEETTDDEESTTTTEDEEESTTTTEEESTTTTEDETTTTEGGPSTGGDDELSMDGQTTASGFVAGDDRAFFTVTVPQGTSAVLTVTPDSDADIVVIVDGQEFDEGLTGDPESIRLTANTTNPFEVEIYEFWGNGAGYFIDLS